MDPRTGLHCVVVGGVLKPFPLLDLISKEDMTAHRVLAQGALSQPERAAMMREGYRLTRTTDNGDDAYVEAQEEEEDEPSLAATHTRRLREIRHMQVYTPPLVTLAP